jgi:hypothetical protein
VALADAELAQQVGGGLVGDAEADAERVGYLETSFLPGRRFTSPAD